MKNFILLLIMTLAIASFASTPHSMGTPQVGGDWGLYDASAEEWVAEKVNVEGVQITKNEHEAAADGELSGYNAYHIKGINLTLSSAFELVSSYSSGEVPVQSTAVSVEISSSSASDAAAGVGLRTVKVYGIKGDFTLASETVTMNGTTSVECASKYICILWLEPVTVGSTGYNVGTIYAYFGTAAAGVPWDLVTPCVMATIKSPGHNGNGKFFVPINCTASVTNIDVVTSGINATGSVTSEIEVVGWRKPYGKAPYAFVNFIAGYGSGAIHREINYALDEKDYIWFEAKSNSAGDDCAVSACVIVNSN